MAEREPVVEEPFNPHDPTATAWAEGRRRLAEGGTYWLATVRPDGAPHLGPVLAVWTDGALCFSTGEGTRKGKNLARDGRCAIGVGAPGLDLVVEGEAAKVRDDGKLRRAAALYASKYGWEVAVRDGAFHDAEGAPTAGPPPYGVYEIAPATVFGFATDENLAPTRWRFSEGDGRLT